MPMLVRDESMTTDAVSAPSLTPTRRISANEAAIIAALADGKQSKEIARCVKLSRASIDTYIRILYGKFDARSRAQLVARAYALGILT